MQIHENVKFQIEGLKWLYEMELMTSPQLINNLKLNIYAISPKIKDMQLLVVQDQKSMLIWVKLSFLGRLFYKEEIFNSILDRVKQLLPSYRVRVIDDLKIFNMALTKAKQLTGELNENSNQATNDRGNDSSDGSGDKLQPTSDLLSNQEKPAED